MKKLSLLLSALSLFLGSLHCQLITTDPALPTPGVLIKIIYDSSKDTGELHNYTGDLYAHTGLFIQGLTGWQKVIGTWGDNSTQPKLTYTGNYIYELEISPDINTFYSTSPTDIVTKICLVIRNSNATLQTNPDILIDVFQVGLNVTFNLPAKYSFVTGLSDQILIQASATMADSVSLYINDQFIKSGLTAELVTHTIMTDDYGEFWVKAVAWDKPNFAADSFFFYVIKPPVTEALPTGLSDGINYTGSTSATLVLYAPYKNNVFLTGDFTDWLAREKGYMKKTPDGEKYWIEITGLEPGKEYRYQYLVDTTLYIADPYSDKILDPDNDHFISSDTYPGLIAYPKDNASGIVSVLKTAETPYSWTTNSYLPPPPESLNIYELLIRDFTANHNYKTLIDTLSYLDDLGINAIELMPINEFEGNLSWGYNPSFYFAPDKYYGPKDDLKAFVDSCHNRGIAVIIDLVLNHCFGQSPFVQLYVDHYGTDQIYMKTPNPWFNSYSPNPIYKWGADFNHQSLQTQSLVDRINSYWLTEYKVDGFRFDFTKGFTNTAGDGSSYDASRIAILKRMADQIWNVNPSAYVILEHFAPNSEEMELADYGMMIWGNNNYNYAEAAMGYASDLTSVSASGRGWSVPNLISYMESHDEERIMFKTLNYGASSGDYDTKDLRTALKRMELDALFLLVVPGPKMIWQFGEMGYDISIDYNGRTGEKPVKWDYLNTPNRYGLFSIYKLLFNLRKSQPAFSTNDYTYSFTTSMKQLQLTDASMKVNVLGNFGITQDIIIPSFPQTGKWYEYFSEDSVSVTDVNEPVILEPGEYRLYTTKKLESPLYILSTDNNQKTDNEHFISVYPNPSHDYFNIEISSQYPAPSYISIYNFNGTLINHYMSGASPSGKQSVIWDGRSSSGYDVASGIYIVQVRSGFNHETIKILKK